MKKKNAKKAPEKKVYDGIAKAIVRGEIRYVANTTIGGKRVKKYRKTLSEAKDALADLKMRKQVAFSELANLTGSQIADVKAALDALPMGETLLGCVERACEFLATKKPSEISEDFLKSKKRRNLSADEYGHVDGRIEDFCATFKEFKDATPAALLEYLQKKGAPKTVLNWRGTIADFLTYAHKRDIIKTNPFSRIYMDDFVKPAKKPPEFLTVEQTKTLLRLLEKIAPQFIKRYVLGLFAALRTSEIFKLKDSWIDYEHRRIILPAEIVKTKDSWTLETLPDNFWAWMDAYKDQPIKEPSYKWWEKHLKPLNLPHNFARHSFPTYHASLYHDAKRTIMITRHANEQTLKDHYWGALLPKAEAEEYFKISPRAGSEG